MITTLNVKIDTETKQSLKEFAHELGVPVSSLVNGSIKQMLRDRSVTFNTKLEPTPYLEKIMREADADIATGRNLSPTFSSVDEMLDYLKKTA
jgi:antitoxin component of RelBE/YafQ-DinJ toxin-antitoxin module